MSVRVEGGAVRLAGACPVGEAETLLAALDAHPDAAVDLSAATALHTAIVQLLLARRPAIVGAAPADPFLATWITPLLGGRAEPMSSPARGGEDDDHDPDRR